MEGHHNRGLYIFVGVLVIFVLAIGFGFQFFLRSEPNSTQGGPVAKVDVEMLKKGKVRKITIRKQDQAGCMEVSPNGTVRLFVTCGGEVTSGKRIENTASIVKLMNIISSGDLAKLPTQGTGPFIDLIIDTDLGTQTVRVYTNGNSGGSGGGVFGGGTSGGNGGSGSGSGGDGDIDWGIIDDIIKIVDDIIEQSTPPTPTPTPENPSPTVGPGTPTQTVTPTIDPLASPTPTIDPKKIPFSCGFDSNGKVRPYNISGIVCSTVPTPLPGY